MNQNLIDNYINAVLKAEEASFRPGLETFPVYAARLRTQLEHEIQTFHARFHRGYDLLLAELKLMHVDNLERFTPNPESEKILGNPETFQKFIDDGHLLYEAYGFSPKELDDFCQAAHRLIAESRPDEAKDAFFYLATIAPHLQEVQKGYESLKVI